MEEGKASPGWLWATTERHGFWLGAESSWPKAYEHLDVWERRVPIGAALMASPEESVFVIGPPRSGKTTAYVEPAVLLAPGPCIVTSTRSDVLNATREYRAQRGDCWIFDPTETAELPPGLKRLRWSPLAAARTYDQAIETASVLTQSYATRTNGAAAGGTAAFFNDRAERLLAALLWAASLAEADMAKVLNWLNTFEFDDPSIVITSADVDEEERAAALSDLATFEHPATNQAAGEWATATNVLGAYRGHKVRTGARGKPFDIERFIAGLAQDSDTEQLDTIYVIADSRRSTVLAPLVASFITSLRDAKVRANEANSEGLYLRFVLDEVTNIATLPDLAELISQAGGSGIQLLVAIQDPAQAEARWGVEAASFVSLANNVVVLPGVRNRELLATLSQLGGDYEKMHEYQVSAPPPGTYEHAQRVLTAYDLAFKTSPLYRPRVPSVGMPAHQHRWQQKQMLPPELISHLPQGMALVFCSNSIEYVTAFPFHGDYWSLFLDLPDDLAEDDKTSKIWTEGVEHISRRTMVVCSKCDGVGSVGDVPLQEQEVCSKCGGRGLIEDRRE